MSSAAFKQAFEKWKLDSHEEFRTVMATTIVKIVEHRTFLFESIMKKQWIQDLQAEGLDISMLSNPCTLGPVENSKLDHTLNMPELKHVFSDAMYKNISKEPSGGGCAISNIRALNEALAQNPNAKLIIVLEADIEPEKNLQHLMAHFLANFHGNPDLKDCQYVALTWSNWHDKYAQDIRSYNSRIIPSTKCQPYFVMRTVPVDWREGDWKYIWFGQGSRALAYRREFAEALVQKRIYNWYDLWVLNELTETCKRLGGPSFHRKIFACVVDPPLWAHIPSFQDRFRDSGRLQSQAINAAEEHAEYICVNLALREWGFANVVQTVALTLGLAAMLQYGIYFLFPNKKKSIDEPLMDLIEWNQNAELMKRIPFIQWYYSEKDKQWQHNSRNTRYCRATFGSQGPVHQGIEIFFETIEEVLNRNPHLSEPNPMVIASMRETLKPEKCWEMIDVPTRLKEDAAAFMNKPHPTIKVPHHVGFHVRRGDFAYFHRTKALEDMKSDADKEELTAMWLAADNEIEDCVTKVN